MNGFGLTQQQSYMPFMYDVIRSGHRHGGSQQGSFSLHSAIMSKQGGVLGRKQQIAHGLVFGAIYTKTYPPILSLQTSFLRKVIVEYLQCVIHSILFFFYLKHQEKQQPEQEFCLVLKSQLCSYLNNLLIFLDPIWNNLDKTLS